MSAFLGVALCCAALVSCRTAPPTSAPDGPGDVTERLREVARRYADYGFQGAVLVERRGEVLLREAFGWADREAGVANTADTRFPLASITKSFTAMTVLRLVDEGLLTLDASLGELLPDVPRDKRSITVRHLLTHTSGLGKMEGRFSFGKDLDRAELLRRILDSDLRTVPGASFDYENENYNLLALIVEQVTGEPYEEQIRSLVLDPLGLTETGFRGATDEPIASGHFDAEDGGLESHTEPYTVESLGASGLVSTVDDLARWGRAWREGSGLTEPLAREALAPEAEDFGFAWRIEEGPSGAPTFRTAGDMTGLQNELRIVPAEDLTIVVLANTRAGGIPWRLDVADALEAVASGRAFEPPRAVRPAADRTVPGGRYALGPGDEVVVRSQAKRSSVVGRGPRATGILAFPDREPPAMVDVLERRVRESASGLEQGDLGPLERWATPGWAREIAGSWKRLQSEDRPLSSLRILGTVPNGPVRLTTYLEVEREGAPPLVVRFLWDEGAERIVGAATDRRDPIRLRLFPLAGGGWGSYGATRSEQVILRFEPESGTLRIETSRSVATARRLG